MNGQPRVGDRVRVLSSGYVRAREYIGQVGTLDHIERDSEGRIAGYQVEFADDLVIASAVELAVKP